MPHTVIQVEPGSAASRAGIQVGDKLVAIDGRIVRDLVDYQAFTCARRLTLTVERAGESREIAIRKGEYDRLGLGFDQPLMSRQRDCCNQCVFCFVDQLPKNVRETMRVKDDDWRMSLMMGNFVTMTNVSDAELARIIARRASPLYISVHATDPELRAMMLGLKDGGKLMRQLTALKDAGLAFHAQAVLCPGLNDGAALDRTVNDLQSLGNACLSLALVPVGLTGHRDGLYPLKPYDAAGAARVLDAVDRYRARFLKERGEALVHAADEFYLIAGRDFPPDEAYEGYPQLENGVGLCRKLETEYREAWEDADLTGIAPRKIAIACGVSVAPFLRGLLEKMPAPGVAVEVHAVENRFFGPTVTVSGLLTGSDLMRLPALDAEKLLISQSMLREGEDVFLDDVRLDAVAAALGLPIETVWDGDALLKALTGR